MEVMVVCNLMLIFFKCIVCRNYFSCVYVFFSFAIQKIFVCKLRAQNSLHLVFLLERVVYSMYLCDGMQPIWMICTHGARRDLSALQFTEKKTTNDITLKPHSHSQSPNREKIIKKTNRTGEKYVHNCLASQRMIYEPHMFRLPYNFHLISSSFDFIQKCASFALCFSHFKPTDNYPFLNVLLGLSMESFLHGCDACECTKLGNCMPKSEVQPKQMSASLQSSFGSEEK